MTTPTQLAYADAFTAEALYRLATQEIAFIWHKGFYPPPDAEAILPRLIKACEASSYTLTQDLQSLGTSIGEASESSEAMERYLATAAATTSLIRDVICENRKSPTDLIRLLADEYWPAGATVARYQTSMMLPGIMRRWPTGGHANPHIDQREVPLLQPLSLSVRIGVNVYLETPPPGGGGEIEFWGRIADEADYRAIRREDYGLSRDTLGDPVSTLALSQGDLLLFDAARIHGVAEVTRGSRATAACFIGVRSLREPLVLFA